ncbi:hypothetical protein E2I00_019952 [Balaenoptera physalus]|uniref:LIM zinc-binding domain-containing protein n=1 Tax=Balaenoptera physalus TaxID=9770 RepID=A0A6A1QQD9_BALPH|nr:hypothetical protein E2I00_019952 [Balaenoptera physalus]
MRGAGLACGAFPAATGEPGPRGLRHRPRRHGDDHAVTISSDRAAPCAGCGVKISDRYYLLAVDTQWHVRCLKRCECKLNLESELTCFSKDGSIYCKEDYYRRFSVQRCARCHLGIAASEMVMRA